MSQVVKILEAHFITHDVKRFVTEKPKGFTFIPGQGAAISINLPNWKDQQRPFTFTNLNGENYLEFMIKIYPQYHGVTEQLGKTNAGDELIIGNVFGAIQYKAPGVFIAGGSGITPFMAIFRELYHTRKIAGNLLINSNKTAQDVIMGNELTNMLKENFINVYTRENTIGFLGRRIDRNFLIETIVDFSCPFYICGPQEFVSNISKLLVDLGADIDQLVIEK